MALLQNRVSRSLNRAGVLPACILARSARTGPCAGRPVPQSRPSADRIHPPAGTALAPTSESALAKGALGERANRM
jgi:hypothetical protein